MRENIVDKLKFRDSKLGYVKVNDGSVIILRVALIDVRVREEASPFGAEFEVNATGGISVYPSESVLNEVKDKQIVDPGKTVNEGWVRVDIVEMKPAYEEAIYDDIKVGKYLIRVEIEPIMVSRNTQYKTLQGLPLYVVRWVPKISWNKIQEGSERDKNKELYIKR